jgi:hypothetical protein
LDDNIRDFVRTNRDAHSVYAMVRLEYNNP